ncbi:hypothetical protein ACF3M2_17620 [Tissierella carlieri]|uniref:hypothetical protein n=1 Tax=Tissierella carlieri TaxID=689904 RepID=UPI0038681AC5
METRLERNKRLKKQRRINRVKKFYILILFLLLILGLEIVNQNIVELDCLDNPNILRFDINTKKLDLFGKSYIIDLSFIRKVFKEAL